MSEQTSSKRVNEASIDDTFQTLKMLEHQEATTFMIAVEVARIQATMGNDDIAMGGLILALDILDLNRSYSVELIVGIAKMTAWDHLHLLTELKERLLEYWISKNETPAFVLDRERQPGWNK